MNDQVKGRRASERRRQRHDEDVPEEATMPGTADAVDGDEEDGDTESTAANAANPVAPPATGRRERTGVTGFTGMTSVGDAADNMLKQEPLERTKVQPKQEAPEPLGGRLIVLEGKDVGKSFDIQELEVVVGRGKDAHIKLSDPAVSRIHFALRYDGLRNAYLFSARVTDPAPVLNGEEAAGSERELADGDVIEIGDTTIRFVRVDGPAPQPKDVPKVKDPSIRGPVVEKEATVVRVRAALQQLGQNAVLMKRMVALGVVVVLAVGVAGLYGIRAYKTAARESELADPQGSFQKLLAQAQAMRESRRWEDLASTGKALVVIAPEREDGARLEKEAREEQLAERNINLGRMNYASSQFDAARSVLRLVPDSSVYVEDRDRLLAQSSEVGRAGAISSIQQLMAQGRFKEASEKLETHLSSYPDDEEARGMKAQSVRLNAAKEAMGTPAWQATRARAVGALDSGDMPGAIAIVEAVESGTDAAHAKPFANKVRALQQAWRQGKDLLASKSKKAVEPLERAKKLEAELSGGKTAITRDISRALADAYYLLGIDAMGAGRECEALASFERAREERPGDAKVADKLSRIAGHGRELLGKAEAARAGGRKSEAVKLAKDAACRIPAGDEDRKRAERIAGGKG